MKSNRFLFLMILLIVSLIVPNISYSQAIRKKYNEMTSQERINYVNVLNSLYSSGDIQQFVFDHFPAGLGYSQHSGQVANYNFLPWHRIFLYYFEKKLQSVNPKVNLVYWDWTNPGDWSSSSLLFSDGSIPEGLLGQPLNPAWDSWVIRSFGMAGAPQPTVSTLNSLIGTASYHTFAVNLENDPHGGTHCWIGGNMCNASDAPSDPVFYLHHSMVDKVWQDWVEANWNGSPIGMIGTSLGTITGKPTIDCNTIIDSRALKVWYAVNDEVVIDKYTVSNTTLGVSTGTEKYNYTGAIKFSTNSTRTFTVPNGQSCESISAKEIILNPGFLADAGSVFEASINTTVFNTPKIGNEAFDPDNLDSQYDQAISDQMQKATLKISPNPSSGIFDLILLANENTTYEYTVYNALGNQIRQVKDQKNIGTKLDLTGQQPGLYIIKMQLDSGELLSETLIVN